VLTLVRALIVLALLAVPLLVVSALPRLYELVNAIPGVSNPAPPPTPFRLTEPTPTARGRVAQVEQTPPPTLAPPAPTTPTARPTPSGEQVVVTNTGGIGAVLRAEPISGPQVASLREQLVLTVLEHRTIGSAEWLRVRTPDGQEGWVTALVARPVPAARP
jgi:Bacterial SH3 domain